MSYKTKPDGCATMLRRTFLFLMGLAIAKILADFFSIAQNRSNFINFVNGLWQKWMVFIETRDRSVTQKPLPNAPIPQTRVTPQSLPNAPLPQTTPQPLPNAPIPQTSVNPKQTNPFTTPKLTVVAKKGRPVEVFQNTVDGVSFYQTTIDLSDPEIFLTMGLANNAEFANSAIANVGDEPFEKFVERHQAAVVANGTFFSKDAQKRVMGNMVAGGKFLKYSRWENFGTTLGIRADNQLEMITARSDGKPEWNQHWFSLTCGPRLLKQGKVWLSPKLEGFTDPHVLEVGYRTAIGFPANKKQLFLITFLASLSLPDEAQIMKAIGCSEAMNLDGGASEGLAVNGEILLPAGRNLTNVIVVYDTNYPAPAALKTSWQRFQNGDRPSYPG